MTKDKLREHIKQYMLERNLGYMEIQASMNARKTNVKMNTIEDEEEDLLDTLLN